MVPDNAYWFSHGTIVVTKKFTKGLGTRKLVSPEAWLGLVYMAQQM